MKKKIFTAAILLTLVPIFSITNAQADGGQVRLMDVDRILQSCGMQNGTYTFNSTVAQKVDEEDVMGIGSIEQNKVSIDTQEEFITAAYYNIKILPAKAQKAINAELPQGKAGALRLAAMWMKKRTEQSGGYDGCLKALQIIKEKSGVSDAEISTYFLTAIEKEALKYGREYLAKYYTHAELKDVLKPLVEYYKNPTTDN